MLITRECDYAVRVIRALNGEPRLSVNEICEREDITAPFAYKILKKLQKAELVVGFRGVHGGYVLNKQLSEISLLDIYLAIDPDLFIIDCLNIWVVAVLLITRTVCSIYFKFHLLPPSFIEICINCLIPCLAFHLFYPPLKVVYPSTFLSRKNK